MATGVSVFSYLSRLNYRRRATADVMIDRHTCGAEKHQGCEHHDTELPDPGLHGL